MSPAFANQDCSLIITFEMKDLVSNIIYHQQKETVSSYFLF